MEKLLISLLSFFGFFGGGETPPQDIPHITPGQTQTIPSSDLQASTMEETPSSEVSPEEEQKKAVQIIHDFLMGLEQFRQMEGQNIQITNVLEGVCEGCWVIDTRFYLNSPQDPTRQEIFTSKVTLKDWKVTDNVFGKAGKVYRDLETCYREKGRVSETGQCENYELALGDFILPNNVTTVCCGPNPQVPSPALQFCTDHQGLLFERTIERGKTENFCIFENGSECEVWDFFRGNCAPEETKTYQLEDPLKCRVIKTSCEEGEPFRDDKGCGCEKEFSCSATYEPVCATLENGDKKSFGNVCLAVKEGVKEFKKGECSHINATYEDFELEDIKDQIKDKHFEKEDELVLHIIDGDENHIRGSIRKSNENQGVLFLAAKKDEKWEAVYYGRSNPECKEVLPYGFPPRMISHCPLWLEEEAENTSSLETQEEDQDTSLLQDETPKEEDEKAPQQTQNSLQSLMQTLADHFEVKIEEIEIEIESATADYVKGTFAPQEKPEERLTFYAGKKEDLWELISYDQKEIVCEDLRLFGVPPSMQEGCQEEILEEVPSEKAPEMSDQEENEPLEEAPEPQTEESEALPETEEQEEVLETEENEMSDREDDEALEEAPELQTEESEALPETEEQEEVLETEENEMSDRKDDEALEEDRETSVDIDLEGGSLPEENIKSGEDASENISNLDIKEEDVQKLQEMNEKIQNGERSLSAEDLKKIEEILNSYEELVEIKKMWEEMQGEN